MKFIGNLYLYFIVFATIWSGALVFVCNAGIYSWLAVIALSILIFNPIEFNEFRKR